MSGQTAAVSAVLEDGGQVSIRPADAGDEAALAAFYSRLGVHDGHPRFAHGRGAADAAAGEAAALMPIGQSVTAHRRAAPGRPARRGPAVVAELDINPLILYPNGCAAVDVKIRVASVPVIDPYPRELR